MIADSRTSQSVETRVVEFQAHNDCVSCCHFCYNDSVILTASYDGTVALWVSCLARLNYTIGRASYNYSCYFGVGCK